MPEVKNFCPDTGVGRFNAKLEGSELKVRTKLHIVTALDNVQEGTFKSRFGPLIKQHWEGKFGFQCSNNSFPNIYKPVFEIKYVDEMLNSHFVLNLLDGGGGTELVARDVYHRVDKNYTGFKPTSANLFSGSVLPTNSSGDLLKDLKASFPFYLDYNGLTPTTHSSNQLKFLAKQLAKLSPNTSVKVTAYGANLSQKRKTSVQMLESCGLKNVSWRYSLKPVWKTSTSRSTGNADYVKVSLGGTVDTDNFNVTQHPLFTYPAAAVHEYGHMLGLMDEYACLSKKSSDKMVELNFIKADEQNQWETFNIQKQKGTASERVATGQMNFIQACKDANVAPPAYGQHTISIMSSGSKFLACHFVTLWAAIVEMTKGSTTADEWSIVKI